MAKHDISRIPDPARDPVARAAEAARRANAGNAGTTHNTGKANDPLDGTSVERSAAASSRVSFEPGVERSTGSGRVDTPAIDRVGWEPRSYPKWWLVGPGVVALAGLTAWQINGIRNHSEEDLQKRALVSLQKRYPNASLQFSGRDAVVSGVSAADRQSAHELVRSVKGVRHVTEQLVGGGATSTIVAPASAGDTFAAPDSAGVVGVVSTTAQTVPATKAAPTVSVETTAPAAPTSAEPPSIATPTTAAPTQTAPPATAIDATGGQDQVISFTKGSCDLTTESAANLDTMASFLVANPDLRLAVGGHADSRGTRIGNLAVSTCRADAVRDALIGRGVPVDQITARGFGSRFAIADNGTDAGRKQNRRAELRLVGARDAVSYTG